MAYTDVVLADSPLAYYRLGETSGTTLVDSSGNGRNGTYYSSPSLNQTGLLAGDANKAVDFPNNSARAKVADASWMRVTTAFTAEAWFNADATNGSRVIVARTGWSNAESNAATRSWHLIIYNGYLHIAVTATDGTYVAHHATGYAINTGTTYHAALTFNGTSVKLYLNGSEIYTSNTLSGKTVSQVAGYSLGIATEHLYDAAADSSGRFDGRIDEVAYYNTALSGARVLAHYNEGLSSHAGYTAQVMTASAMTNDATVKASIRRRLIPIGIAQPNSPNASSGGAVVSLNPGFIGHLNIPGPDLDAGEYVVSAKLLLTSVITVSNDAVTLKRITEDWDINTLTYNNRPSSVSETIANQNWVEGTPNVIDVTSILAQPNYGLSIQSFNAIISGINARIEYIIATATSVSPAASPMTATAEAPEADVSIYRDNTYVASAITASADMPTPVIIAEHDFVFVAEDITAEATMPGGGFTYPAEYVASAVTADASSPTATAVTTIGVNAIAGPMVGMARIVQIAEVNGTVPPTDDTIDRYYNRVKALKPQFWVRWQDAGSVVTNRTNQGGTYPINGNEGNTPIADVTGNVQVNKHDGPDGRASIHFSNGAVVQREGDYAFGQDETVPFSNTGAYNDHALEFSIKTTKANQFILGGNDANLSGAQYSPNYTADDIGLVDGKVNIHRYRTQFIPTSGNTVNESTSIGTGFKRIDDGEWHHIVIRYTKSSVRDEYGITVWIDGKLDFTRLVKRTLSFNFPDYIGNRPSVVDGVNVGADTAAIGRNFEGDMSELVVYGLSVVNNDDVIRNYYAFMGWLPIEANPMLATADTADAYGKGNQKRALYLYFSGLDEVFGGMPGKSGQKLEDSISFDPNPGLAGQSYAGGVTSGGDFSYEEVADFAGYKVFTRSVTVDSRGLQHGQENNFTSYRDLVTDEQSLIDLTRHVDLRDYDVIMFKDWPDESYERDYYEANYPGQLDRLLGQIRDANEEGMGLFITNPRLAIDLGIIDAVEFVPPLTERKFAQGQGRAEGAYDYGSALKFPWNIVGSDGLSGNQFAAGIGQAQNTDPNYLAQKAYFYFDNNRNNKFRVRALIDGLTNIPSYMIEDAAFHIDADQYGWEGVAYKYLRRMGGLQIGDEYIFNGSPTVDPRFMSETDLRYLRTNGTWATPPGAVNAGVVVTTFGAKHFVNGVETTNPYADYATTIVLDSGTNLNGRSTGGRIFVNFSETPTGGNDAPVQVLPGSPDSTDVSVGETLDIDAPVFVINGTDEQKALTEAALARCTFPFGNLQDRIKAKFGTATTAIVWTDIEPGEDDSTLGRFNSQTGVIEMDQDLIEDSALRKGLDAEDLAMSTLIHELAHLVDYVYLAPYQRVNIWNVFHEPWNVWHEDQNLGNYILPVGYPLDMSTTNIYSGEGWGNAGSYRYERIAEAYAQAFVQAYTDIPVDVFAYTRKSGNNIVDGHPAPESIGPKIRGAIETGGNAYLFDQSQVDSEWPRGYPEETNAQREWEYSWTRTSLRFTASALKTRIVKVTMPDGSVQNIEQGSTIGTRGDIPLSMVRSSQLFPVISKPRLEMTARGLYWLYDAPEVAEGDAVVRATPMEAIGTTPTATPIVQASKAVLAQPMAAVGQMPEAEQAKSGNATVLVFAMTASADFSQGSERTVTTTPMTALGTMPDTVSKVSGEGITLRLPRPARITLQIKEAG